MVIAVNMVEDIDIIVAVIDIALSQSIFPLGFSNE